MQPQRTCHRKANDTVERVDQEFGTRKVSTCGDKIASGAIHRTLTERMTSASAQCDFGIDHFAGSMIRSVCSSCKPLLTICLQPDGHSTSMRSLLQLSFNRAFRRGLHTTSFAACCNPSSRNIVAANRVIGTAPNAGDPAWIVATRKLCQRLAVPFLKVAATGHVVRLPYISACQPLLPVPLLR